MPNKRTFVGTYTKVYSNLLQVFQEKNLSPKARLMYQVLSLYLENNSNIATTSLKSLKSGTGFNSDTTICNALTELAKAGLIKKTDSAITQYELLSSVFKGIVEKSEAEADFSLPTTPKYGEGTPKYGVQSLARYNTQTYSSSKKLKEINSQQQGPVVVDLKSKFVFSNQSPYEKISEEILADFTQAFGFEKVQEKIVLLEFQLKRQKKSALIRTPAGHLFTALEHNFDPGDNQLLKRSLVNRMLDLKLAHPDLPWTSHVGEPEDERREEADSESIGDAYLKNRDEHSGQENVGQKGVCESERIMKAKAAIKSYSDPQKAELIEFIKESLYPGFDSLSEEEKQKLMVGGYLKLCRTETKEVLVY